MCLCEARVRARALRVRESKQNPTGTPWWTQPSGVRKAGPPNLAVKSKVTSRPVVNCFLTACSTTSQRSLSARKGWEKRDRCYWLFTPLFSSPSQRFHSFVLHFFGAFLPSQHWHRSHGSARDGRVKKEGKALRPARQLLRMHLLQFDSPGNTTADLKGLLHLSFRRPRHWKTSRHPWSTPLTLVQSWGLPRPAVLCQPRTDSGIGLSKTNTSEPTVLSTDTDTAISFPSPKVILYSVLQCVTYYTEDSDFSTKCSEFKWHFTDKNVRTSEPFSF